MKDIFRLLKDSQMCAEYLGLIYGNIEQNCYTRRRHGKGYLYFKDNSKVGDTKIIAYCKQLAIPPAWNDVQISCNQKSYILATGQDTEGRKQYIYHPEWFAGREMLQFYKLIHFGRHLTPIRTWIGQHLTDSSQDRTLAGLLLTLDLTAIRVGNQNYYDERETVGLTTLKKEHVHIDKEGITFHFTGKSGQEIHTSRADETLIDFYKPLLRGKNDFLFPDIQPQHINDLLFDITKKHFTAKDFRTWGGTVWAYEKLVEEKATPLEAIDFAASMLGNTRSVARTYYIHPHMLEASEDEKYRGYFGQRKTTSGLMKPSEYHLLRLLRRLKKERFAF